MQTYFAPAERAGSDELHHAAAAVGKDPVIGGLLEFVGGLLAILNEQRQIIAVNDQLARALGVTDPGTALGLRPGEALKCIHAQEMQGGCGTSRYCSTCGAALAIVAGLSTDGPAERKCVLTVFRDGRALDLCFSVRAQAVTINGLRLVLLFMQDITEQEWRAACERHFFHDLGNIVTGLVGTSELMAAIGVEEQRRLVGLLRQLVGRLESELRIRSVLAGSTGSYTPRLEEVTITQVFEGIRRLCASHPLAEGRTVSLPEDDAPGRLWTDPAVLSTVLECMLKNALEATGEGGTVKLWCERAAGRVTFKVWNGGAIPEAVALRIFQRHFTTRKTAGRGLGTYLMKLFGEQVLRGTVTFTTSEAEGTTFILSLPA